MLFLIGACGWITYLLPPLKKQGLTKRKDDSIIHSANIDDVKLLLEACDRSTFTGFRDYVMILVMLDTGIRMCELFRLTNSDYDTNSRTLLIRKQNSKTRQERICYLSDNVALTLNRFLKTKPKEIEWLFPSRDGYQFSANYMA